MAVILNVAALSVALYFFYSQSKQQCPQVFVTAFLVRLIAAISLGLLYKYHYTAGDTWNYMNNSMMVTDYIKNDFGLFASFIWDEELTPELTQKLTLHDRSLLLVKLLTPIALITHGNYWLSSIYCAFISFVAAWVLFQTICNYYPQYAKATAVAFLYFPSVVFWSSGIIKETFAMACMAVITAIIIRLFNAKRLALLQVIFVLVCFYVVWRLKYYWAALFAVVILTTFLSYAIEKWKNLPFSLTWFTIFIFFAAIVTFLHPNFHINRIFEVIVENNQQFMSLSAPNEAIHFTDLQPTWQSMLLHAPLALFSGLFRPFLWEAHGLMALIASIENFAVLLLVFTWLFSQIKLPPRILLPLVMFCVLLCIFLTLSTPNFGTLSRYRIGFLPFLIFLLTAHNQTINKLFKRAPLYFYKFKVLK
ncbi:MAG: hypothetical protein ACKO96_20290 [Flammeovirgaceae bacterium]